jgi:hypothetical protein
MGQFDYLRDQISNNIWIDKEALQISDAVTTALNNGQEWYFNLPHIKFIMENSSLRGIKDLLTASQDLGSTVLDCNLVFLETVYGINKAFNSKVHKDLAGKAQIELQKLANNNTEKAIYEASVLAHNESLNLPELSVKVAAIEAEIASIQQQGATAIEQIEQWKNDAITKLEQLKNELLTLIEGLLGNPRRNARARLKIVEAGIVAMQTGTIPPIIAMNPYEITSKFDRPITSTFRRQPVINAIVPIAAGGAATVAGAATVLTGIAGWLLSSFFLKAASIPATLLPALTNTVVSIVLKVVDSSGANAMRYLAASVLKAGQSLLPKIFGATGLQVSGWAYLMAWAAPIIGAAVIIIQAMRNKTSLAELLYVFADIQGSSTGKFHLSQAYMQDTNKVEILEQFKTSSKRLLQKAPLPIERIIGVGLNNKKDYAVAYDLTNPDNPIQILGEEAIVTALGTDKIDKIASGKFFFFD